MGPFFFRGNFFAQIVEKVKIVREEIVRETEDRRQFEVDSQANKSLGLQVRWDVESNVVVFSSFR